MTTNLFSFFPTQILRKTVQKTLKKARELQVKSIAFPVIGTCGLGFPKNQASHILISEVIETVKKWGAGSCVKDIRFVVFDKDPSLVKAFQIEFVNLFQPNNASTSSTSTELDEGSKSEGQALSIVSTDQKHFTTERFSCSNIGLKRYLIENKKVELKSILGNAQNDLSINVNTSEISSKDFEIYGDADSIKRSTKELNDLCRSILTRSTEVRQAGITTNFLSKDGAGILKSVEQEHHCTIELIPEHSSVETLPTPSEARPSTLDNDTCVFDVRISWKRGDIANENVSLNIQCRFIRLGIIHKVLNLFHCLLKQGQVK